MQHNRRQMLEFSPVLLLPHLLLWWDGAGSKDQHCVTIPVLCTKKQVQKITWQSQPVSVWPSVSSKGLVQSFPNISSVVQEIPGMDNNREYSVLSRCELSLLTNTQHPSIPLPLPVSPWASLEHQGGKSSVLASCARNTQNSLTILKKLLPKGL